MRSLNKRDKPIPALFVKSLNGRASDTDIRDIFEKARETAPCLLVCEDLDGLIHENVRSFFLNELDGLEQNHGILMIGSTNYCKTEPSPNSADLIGRQWTSSMSPSPNAQADLIGSTILPFQLLLSGRVIVIIGGKGNQPFPSLYSGIVVVNEICRLKLCANGGLRLDEGFSERLARITEGLSFAYLQEIFVSAILSLISEGQTSVAPHPVESQPVEQISPGQFWIAVSKQVEKIRKEMVDSKKSVDDASKNTAVGDAKSSSGRSTGFAS